MKNLFKMSFLAFSLILMMTSCNSCGSSSKTKQLDSNKVDSPQVDSSKIDSNQIDSTKIKVDSAKQSK